MPSVTELFGRAAGTGDRHEAPDEGPLQVVSVFSGAMGLDLGLEAAGFELRFAADNMPAAVETARKNRPDLPVYAGDVAELDPDTIYALSGLAPGEVDLLAGGPPCQSFSTAGKRLGLDDSKKGPLVYEFFRLVDELRPRAFLVVNVECLLCGSDRCRELP